MRQKEHCPMLMKLLLGPAIDARARGCKISGFGLIVIAAVLIIAPLKAAGIFLGSSLFTSTVWKIGKHAQKKWLPPGYRGR